MSNTSVFDQHRIAYRPAVVELFKKGADPEIQRAAGDIAGWQAEVNRLTGQIGDAERYIAELRQALKDVEAHADLPPAGMLLNSPQGAPSGHADAFGGPQTGTFMPLLCVCGEQMEADDKRGLIHRDSDGWTVAGESCKRAKDSTKVLPAIEGESP